MQELNMLERRILSVLNITGIVFIEVDKIANILNHDFQTINKTLFELEKKNIVVINFLTDKKCVCAANRIKLKKICSALQFVKHLLFFKTKYTKRSNKQC